MDQAVEDIANSLGFNVRRKQKPHRIGLFITHEDQVQQDVGLSIVWGQGMHSQVYSTRAKQVVDLFWLDRIPRPNILLNAECAFSGKGRIEFVLVEKEPPYDNVDVPYDIGVWGGDGLGRNLTLPQIEGTLRAFADLVHEGAI